MGHFQITCIIPDGADADRRIDRLGGTFSDNPETIDTLLMWIDQGHTFWTMARGRAVSVIAMRNAQSGRRYLTTEGDGFPPTNLLALPRCTR